MIESGSLHNDRPGNQPRTEKVAIRPQDEIILFELEPWILECIQFGPLGGIVNIRTEADEHSILAVDIQLDIENRKTNSPFPMVRLAKSNRDPNGYDAVYVFDSTVGREHKTIYGVTDIYKEGINDLLICGKNNKKTNTILKINREYGEYTFLEVQEQRDDPDTQMVAG